MGYAVDPAHRRRGHARAALVALVAEARASSSVRRVRATIAPDNAASLAVLRGLDFGAVGEPGDADDGRETIHEHAW